MYKKETLPNGVRIITEEIPHVRSVSIGLWVGAGSRDEGPEINGMAHFIEHMMFKGTENRTAKQIAESLDAVGGQLNAFTSKEYTCYYAKVLDEHLDVAVDLLADMFFNSLFQPEELEKEKNVIIEEIKMYEDAPDELVHDFFTSTIWNGHALGRPVIGTTEVIRATTREQMVDFYKKFYVPESLVIAVAGSIRHETVVARLAPLFSSFAGSASRREYRTPVASARITGKQKDTEQVHLCLGTPGLPLDHEKTYHLHVLNSILGGGISSRLFQEIREERGLAYSVYSYHSSYRDAGLFTVYTGLSRENLDQVLALISREMKDIKQQGISAEEVQRAKAQLKGSMFLGLENVSNRMSRLGKSELCLNRVVTPDEAADKIDRVTGKDVRQLAEELFVKENFTVAAIGPEQDVAVELPLD